MCTNMEGSFKCTCNDGFEDSTSDPPSEQGTVCIGEIC